MGDVIVKTIKQQFGLVTSAELYVCEGKGVAQRGGSGGQRRWSGVATT